MEKQQLEHLKSLHDTVRSAAESNSSAHIPAKQCKETADALKEAIDSASE